MLGANTALLSRLYYQPLKLKCTLWRFSSSQSHSFRGKTRFESKREREENYWKTENNTSEKSSKIGHSKYLVLGTSALMFAIPLGFHHSSEATTTSTEKPLSTDKELEFQPHPIRAIVRSAGLFFLFLPLGVFFPFTLLSNYFKDLWWGLCLWTLETAGPCWIKLGQWASTRPDLFPSELCQKLSTLHNHCPTHSFSAAKRTLEKTLGAPIEEIFSSFEKTPIASGAIAQVHRAVLKDGTEVAVKVRHPYTPKSVLTDLTIMRFVARQLNRFETFELMSVLDAADQFSVNMKSQLDLSIEGHNLERFRENFKDWKEVRFPRPIISTSAVLIESFEPGVPISELVAKKSTLNTELAKTGIRMYMKMMLQDHLIHADLHPGNLLVDVHKPQFQQQQHHQSSSSHKQNETTGAGLGFSVAVLDVGLVTELSKDEAWRFIQLFRAVVEGNGKYAAELMIKYAPVPPKFKIPGAEEGFKKEVGRLFDGVKDKKLSEVKVGDVLGTLLSATRKYGVKLDGNFATLMVATVVLEGIGRQLDPNINLLEFSIPFLFKTVPQFLLKKSSS